MSARALAATGASVRARVVWHERGASKRAVRYAITGTRRQIVDAMALLVSLPQSHGRIVRTGSEGHIVGAMVYASI